MVKSKPKQADPVLKINANFHSSLDLYVPKPKISENFRRKPNIPENFSAGNFSAGNFFGGNLSRR